MARHDITSTQLARLSTVCELPFADADDLYRLTGTPISTITHQLGVLTTRGLTVSVPHQVGGIARSERYAPTAAGIETVAHSMGMAPDEWLRQSPAHPEVMRALMRRIDTVAVTYHLAGSIATLAQQGTTTVEHFIKGPLDAVIRLETGVTMGVVHRGRLQKQQAFGRRWGAIARQKHRWPDAALVLTTTEIDWEDTCSQMAARPGPRAFCVVGEDVIDPRLAHRAMWLEPGDQYDTYTLADIVRRLPAHSTTTPPRPGPQRAMGSSPLEPEALVASRPAWSLTAADKRLLDLIYDWPLIRRRFLPRLLGVSSARVSQQLRALRREGLITPTTLQRHPCLALSDDGLRYVGYRDRVGLGGLFSERSVAGGPQPDRWFGRMMRRLAHDFRHTDETHEVVVRLAQEARALPDHWLQNLDPPARTRRAFGPGGTSRAVYPDAASEIRVNTDPPWYVSFVLEMERRAVHADRAARKIRLYQDFFAAGNPSYYDEWPLVLAVFDNGAAERRFWETAKALDSDTDRPVRVPFAISHLGQLRETGVLGPSWLVPEEGGQDRRMHLRHLTPKLTDPADSRCRA